MLGKLFPDKQLQTLAPTDNTYKSQPAAEIRYRSFAKTMLGNSTGPQIKVINLAGRNAVYSSRYDISAGIVGMPMDGIIGYTPESATTIVSGITLKQLSGI